MHGSESDMQIWWTPGWKCRITAQPDGAAWVRQFQPRVIIFECHMNDCASCVLLYKMQKSTENVVKMLNFAL